jgi:2-polyprenyl-3-methyl-5-hydroxy-6-metoxy-1,4-benzoquinol methylase
MTRQAFRLQYSWADAEELPASFGTFDVIISFENIEHLRSPEHFFACVKRLANLNAQLMLSTPNRLRYSDHPQSPNQNPYHVLEYGFYELQTLLAPHLTSLAWFGQF